MNLKMILQDVRLETLQINNHTFSKELLNKYSQLKVGFFGILIANPQNELRKIFPQGFGEAT